MNLGGRRMNGEKNNYWLNAGVALAIGFGVVVNHLRMVFRQIQKNGCVI